MYKNKKGSLTEIIGIFITFFVLVVAVISFGIAYEETNTGFEAFMLQENDAVINDSATLFIDQGNKFPVFWDFLIAFLLFGLWLGVMISAYILGNNPLFLVFYVIGSIANIVLASVWQFAMQDFAVATAEYMVNFPITLFIINNFFIFALFFIVTTAIALYMKPGGED